MTVAGQRIPPDEWTCAAVDSLADANTKYPGWKDYNYYGERAVGSGWAKGKVTFISMNQSQVIRF